MNFDLISRKRNNPTTSQLILLLICWFIPKLPGNFSNFFLLFLLNRYCNPQRPLDDSSVLLSLLSTHSPPRKAVVEWCEANNFALKDLRGLLMSLSKPSPVCAMLPASEEMRLLLEKMKTTDVKEEPALLQALQSLCPVLFDVVKNLQCEGRSLPESFNGLLSELWKKSIAPFKGSEQTSNSSSTSADTPLISPAPSTPADAPLTSPAPSSSFEESTSYWPHLPIVRSRDSYPHDLKRDRQTCRKIGKAHRTLLPGSVTLHCQHGRSVHFYFKYLNPPCNPNAERVQLEETCGLRGTVIHKDKYPNL